MNKKYIWIGTLVLIGALAVSAFSWAAITRSNETQRALTDGLASLDTTEQQIRDVASARWMGAALASQSQATVQQIRNVESARWMGAALASQATVQQIRNVESARWMGAALASQSQATVQQIRNFESARWMGAALASQAPSAENLSWPPRPDFSHLNQAPAFHYTPPGR